MARLQNGDLTSCCLKRNKTPEHLIRDGRVFYYNVRIMSANTYLPISPVVPPFLVITAITQANPCVVTVSTSNSYIVGQLVHFTVPSTYKMFQINEMTGKIVAVDPTNLILTVDIDTTQFDAFVVPATFKERPATISPAGSRNIYNTLYVPFHSQGNTGN